MADFNETKGERMTKEQIKEKIQADVTYELIHHEEDTPVRGNCMSSGDDSYDKECEDAIIKDLGCGNLWAWCAVEVRATWKGFTGKDFLGCCSYKDQKDFEAGGYYDDMKSQALDDLCSYVASLKGTLDNL